MISNYNIDILLSFLLLKMMNLLIHSDINSLVTGSAKDYLYVSRSKVLTDFLFLIFFFCGGGGGGVEGSVRKLILPIHS